MKNGWPKTTLDELVESGVIQLTRGKVISKKDIAACPGTFPIYSSAKENSGKFGEYGRYMFDEELITWSVDGGGRLFHRHQHKFSVTNVGGILRIRDKSVLDYKYLYYVLSLRHSEIAFDWVRKAHPSIIRRLYQDIPVPPIPEQQRTVGILDEALNGIAIAKANAEKNLQSARELFESYLHSIFANPGEDWEEKKLGDVCEINTGKWNADHAVEGGAYRFYTCAKEYCFSETKRFSGECLILPGNGVNVGDVYYYDGEFDAYQRTYVLSNIKPSARFVYYHMLFYWRSRNLNKQFGSATNFIKIGNFLDYEIPLPSLAGQRTIVAKLDAFSSETGRLEDVYQRKLDTLEDLKRSLLSAAFDGEL